MVQLTSDLLNGLAEKMFKLYKERRDPPRIDTIFKFMLISRRCRDSMLRQFAKMEEVEFNKQLNDQALEARFYRKQASRENGFFGFKVKSWFVRYLIEYGQLRVKRITFDFDVAKEMCARGGLPAEQLNQMRAIDVLSELLGFEDRIPDYRSASSSISSSTASGVYWTEKSLSADVDRFIALKPKKFGISFDILDVPTQTTETAPKSLCCPRIETVRVFSMPRNFDTALWCNFLRYLSVSCPNLRLLEVDLLLDFMDISRKLAIETTVRALRDEIFPTLASTMAVDSMLKFDMSDFLHLNEMNELLASDHPLLRLGERNRNCVLFSIEVGRKEGAPWQISIRIPNHERDESDGERDSSSDEAE